MRTSVFGLSLVVLILGLVPLIENYVFVLPGLFDFIPRSGDLYSLLIAVAGCILTYISFRRM